MKNRKIILYVRFHYEGLNCYSSKDGTKQVISSFKKIRQFIKDNTKELGSPKHLWYSSDDKVFIVYLSYSYIRDSYKYTSRGDDYASLLIKEHYSKSQKEYRKKKGYVYSFIGDPLPLAEIMGKLPMSIIIDNLSYLSSGVVGGYFGASSRMFKHDEWITELYESEDGMGKIRISSFLNHSDARHFMDNIDEDTSKEDFINRMISYMKSLCES